MPRALSEFKKGHILFDILKTGFVYHQDLIKARSVGGNSILHLCSSLGRGRRHEAREMYDAQRNKESGRGGAIGDDS